jgi:hypothetical protein
MRLHVQVDYYTQSCTIYETTVLFCVLISSIVNNERFKILMASTFPRRGRTYSYMCKGKSVWVGGLSFFSCNFFLSSWKHVYLYIAVY